MNVFLTFSWFIHSQRRKKTEGVIPNTIVCPNARNILLRERKKKRKKRGKKDMASNGLERRDWREKRQPTEPGMYLQPTPSPSLLILSFLSLFLSLIFQRITMEKRREKGRRTDVVWLLKSRIGSLGGGKTSNVRKNANPSGQYWDYLMDEDSERFLSLWMCVFVYDLYLYIYHIFFMCLDPGSLIKDWNITNVTRRFRLWELSLFLFSSSLSSFLLYSLFQTSGFAYFIIRTILMMIHIVSVSNNRTESLDREMTIWNENFFW